MTYTTPNGSLLAAHNLADHAATANLGPLPDQPDNVSELYSDTAYPAVTPDLARVDLNPHG